MSQPVRPSRSRDAQHAVWEREMRRLGLSTRLLAVVLLAVLARIAIGGLTAVNGVAAGVSGSLTLASLLLTRYGRRREPDSRS